MPHTGDYLQGPFGGNALLQTKARSVYMKLRITTNDKSLVEKLRSCKVLHSLTARVAPQEF